MRPRRAAVRSAAATARPSRFVSAVGGGGRTHLRVGRDRGVGRRAARGAPAAGCRAGLFAAALAALALLVAACAAPPRAAPDLDRRPELEAEHPRERPQGTPAQESALAEARALAALGRRGDAVAALVPVLGDGPPFLEGERLLQDLLLAGRGDAWIRQRTEERADRAPDDADAAYLRARITPSRRLQAARFDAAVALDPGHPWARIGQAIGRERTGRAEEAERIAWEVAADAPWLALPWTWLATVAYGRGAPDAAERLLREAVLRDRADARPWAGLAAAFDDQERGDEAARAALEAIRRAPGEPGTLWSMAPLLERSAAPEVLRGALAAVEPARAEAFDRAAVESFRARMLVRLARWQEALEAVAAAREAGASEGDVAVPRRRAAVGAGRPLDAVEEWIAGLPFDPRADGDERRGAWDTLVAAARAGAPAGPADAASLADALAAVGWADEARTVLEQALASWPRDAALASRLDAALAFDAFLGEVALEARELRRRRRRGDRTTLDEALAAIRRASLAHLGADATEGLRMTTFPLLGEFAVSTAGDGAFRDVFARRGLLLLVGARSGGAPEILVGRLVSHRTAVRAASLGAVVEFDPHTLETEGIPEGLAGQRSGAAGITLDRLVILQIDVVRHGVSRDDPGVPYLARAAITDSDLRALDTPSDVSRRIERRLAARGTLDRDTLDAVICHERVHVRDAARLLPPWRHPLAALAFAADHAFSAGGMERTLEARAAVGALVDAAEPRAALASLLGFLPAEDGETPHVAGYRGATATAVDEILRDADAFPSVDPRWNVVQQMDRLTSDECRELGRRVWRRLWGD